ncbi:extracellular solute-binding protein [Bifidobacterium dolichotidis]|nr:extracellular solute-binding protein [Bifidobacterium dolichotidis]
MQDDLSQQTIDAINTKFTHTTGAKVNVQIQPWDGIATKLTTALATGNPPDVIDVGNTKIADFAANGGLLDLSSFTQTLANGNHWIPGLADSAQFDGNTYGVPAFGATRAVIVNKAMWQQAGITAMPRTFSELTEDLRTVQRQFGNSSSFCPFYLPGRNWFAGLQFVWGAGGNAAVRDGMHWQASMSSKASEQGLEQWKAFQNEFSSVASRAAETNNPDMAQIFAQGKTSAIMWNSATVSKILSISETLKPEDIATFPMPNVSGGVQPSVMAGSVWAIPAHSNHASLAMKWIESATNDEIQRKWIVNHDGWLPNSEELLHEFLNGKDLSPIQRGFFEAAEHSQAVPAVVGWSTLEGDGSLKNLFATVAEGKSSIAQAAASFDATANAVFSKNEGLA